MNKKQTNEYDNFELVYDLDSLYEAFNDSKRNVSWKYSIQNFAVHLIHNLLKLQDDLKKGNDIHKGFVEFDINERGKVRHIKSIHISERVVQRSLCTNCLIPAISKSLIYDNSASIKGKGLSFAINRCKKHLTDHYRKYGNEGYVLLIDFKSYFDNINHNVVEKILKEYFTDERILNLTMRLVHAFGEKGLGLGSEISQILAIAYPNKIDHFIKEQLHIKGYGRYMDDSYLIHHDKQYLKQCLKILKEKYKEYGIIVNDKKTKIVKLSRPFNFLKTRFVCTENGKILMLPFRDNITRERHKLKKFRGFLDEGKMDFESIYNSYMSWRGFISQKTSKRTVMSMDKLFIDLFKIELLQMIPTKKKPPKLLLYSHYLQKLYFKENNI